MKRTVHIGKWKINPLSNIKIKRFYLLVSHPIPIPAQQNPNHLIFQDDDDINDEYHYICIFFNINFKYTSELKIVQFNLYLMCAILHNGEL